MAGECCVKTGIPAVHDAKGRFTSISGNNSYESGTGQHILIYATDVYGNTFVNAQRNADAFADAGFHVYIPDLFNGAPMNPKDPDVLAKLPDFISKNPPDKTSEHLNTVAHHVLQQSTSPKSLSFIGLCYGAKPITTLILNDTTAQSKTTAVVFNHPSFLTKEDADQWPSNIPIHINEAEDDFIFKDDLKVHWERVLTEKKIGTFKLYPGTKHGFSARPGNEIEEKARQEAIRESIEFLKKHAGL